MATLKGSETPPQEFPFATLTCFPRICPTAAETKHEKYEKSADGVHREERLWNSG